MWKREEAAKPAPGTNVSGAATGATGTAGRVADRKVVNIGKSVVIKGELSGSEDLTIEGQVEGKIELNQHVLTIGPHGRIRAQVFAKAVVVLGEVLGDIKATDKVSIRDSGSVEGDIAAPKVAIAEGARFRGGIDMQQGAKLKSAEKTAPEGKPKVQAQPQAKAHAKAASPASASAAAARS